MKDRCAVNGVIRFPPKVLNFNIANYSLSSSKKILYAFICSPNRTKLVLSVVHHHDNLFPLTTATIKRVLHEDLLLMTEWDTSLKFMHLVHLCVIHSLVVTRDGITCEGISFIKLLLILLSSVRISNLCKKNFKVKSANSIKE